MSVDMYLDQSQSQSASTEAMVSKQLEAYDRLDQAIQNFSSSGDELQGAAYDSARELVSSSLATLVRGGRLLAEKVREAVAKFPEEYSAQVAPESLRESELREDIAMLTSQIDQAHERLIQIGTSKLSDDNKKTAQTQQNGIIDNLEAAKQQLEEKLDKLLTFHAISPNLFSDIEALDAAIKTGAAQIQNSWDAGQGKFKMMVPQEWVGTINDQQFLHDYEIKRPDGMSDEDWKDYVHTLEEQAASLQEDGWTSDAVKDGYIKYVNEHYKVGGEELQVKLNQYFNDAHTFGSGIFQSMWTVDYNKLESYSDEERSGKAQTLLNIAMKYVGMPEELTGTQEEAKELVGRMSKSLAPHDKFWDTFSKTVQKAYPDDLEYSSDDKKHKHPLNDSNALGAPGGNEALKRQVHQFRYVISAQQAQWVRNNYKEKGMTDAEALQAYFRDGRVSDYEFNHSARLHNKVADGGKEGAIYPDGKKQSNFKILSKNFHTEFIISEDGSFVNEVDPEKADGKNQNGVVNGASFNYASGDKEHSRLDVETPSAYDPQYRKKIINNDGHKFNAPDYDTEYQDSENEIYGRNGFSSKENEDEARNEFYLGIYNFNTGL